MSLKRQIHLLVRLLGLVLGKLLYWAKILFTLVTKVLEVTEFAQLGRENLLLTELLGVIMSQKWRNQGAYGTW